MATVRIEINDEGDLSILKALLNRMSLQFEVEKEEDWGGLPENAIEGIKAGLQDLAAARVHSHEFVMAAMKKKITDFRNKNTC
jgi:predicted transcriptional regulator